MNLPLCSTLLCWVLNQKVQNANSLTPPGRRLKKKRAVSQVHWTLRLMLAWARRQKPPGTQLGCPLLRGTAKGITPCKGSGLRRVMSFEGLKISTLVSRYFEKLLRRMPFPIGIGPARSRTPWSEATMPPR